MCPSRHGALRMAQVPDRELLRLPFLVSGQLAEFARQPLRQPVPLAQSRPWAYERLLYPLGSCVHASLHTSMGHVHDRVPPPSALGQRCGLCLRCRKFEPPCQEHAHTSFALHDTSHRDEIRDWRDVAAMPRLCASSLVSAVFRQECHRLSLESSTRARFPASGARRVLAWLSPPSSSMLARPNRRRKLPHRPAGLIDQVWEWRLRWHRRRTAAAITADRRSGRSEFAERHARTAGSALR